LLNRFSQSEYINWERSGPAMAFLEQAGIARVNGDFAVRLFPVRTVCRRCYLALTRAMYLEIDRQHPEAAARSAVQHKQREAMAERNLQRKQNLPAARRDLRLGDTAEAFECDECGRWTDAYDAWLSHAASVKRLGVSARQFDAIRQESSSTPIRPAFIQREFGKTYEQAVTTLDRADRLGLLRAKSRGFAPAPPLCSPCYDAKRIALDRPSAPAELPSGREPIPPRLRFLVLQRGNFRCTYCGRAARDGAVLHIDHVIPVAAGGGTSEDNLIAACDTCNFGKSDGPVLP
jgi:hypothetical protein